MQAQTTKATVIINFIIWLLIGSIIIWAVVFSYANGFNKIAFSYQNNDIYELPGNTFDYDAPDNNQVIYSIPVFLYKDHFDVNYFRIVAENVEGEEVTVSIAGAMAEEVYNDVFSEMGIALHEGINDIQIPSHDINLLTVIVDGTNNRVIRRAEFRESVDNNQLLGSIPYAILAAIVYIALTGIIAVTIKHRRKAFYSRLGIIRNNIDSFLFHRLLVLNRIYINLNTAYLSIARSFMWCIMITLSLVVEMHGSYFENIRSYILLQMILMIILIALHFEKSSPAVKDERNYGFVLVCLLFTLFIFISDILVDREFRFELSIFMILLLVFAYVWNIIGREGLFIRDFERGTRWFLLVLVLLSVVRANRIDNRFSGPILNPSVYALYLASIWSILLGSLESQIFNNSQRREKVMTLVGLITALILCLLSHSVCPILTACIITIVWLYRVMVYKYGKKVTIRIITVAGIVFFALVIALWHLCGYSDSLFMNSRIIAKLRSADLSTILSGRDYYYRQYCRNMNLFGHGEKPYLWDHKILPHNAVIGMAYNFGVPSIVPYIAMMLLAIYKSWNFANTKKKYRAIPFYCITSFVLLSLADNVEQPFVWLPWIACYMMFAPIMFRKNT